MRTDAEGAGELQAVHLALESPMARSWPATSGWAVVCSRSRKASNSAKMRLGEKYTRMKVISPHEATTYPGPRSFSEKGGELGVVKQMMATEPVF